ncbi:MAG: hypothetical protein H6Q69_317 [Firmicutes bacterium]|nr:hypothetical protein [Bacillota bacterium]
MYFINKGILLLVGISILLVSTCYAASSSDDVRWYTLSDSDGYLVQLDTSTYASKIDEGKYNAIVERTTNKQNNKITVMNIEYVITTDNDKNVITCRSIYGYVNGKSQHNIGDWFVVTNPFEREIAYKLLDYDLNKTKERMTKQ